MSDALPLELADCTEYRQALLARPPGLIHGVAGLLVLLIASALTWADRTRADLVVRVPGRIRPVAEPQRVFSAAGGAAYGAAGGRVVEVHAREGDVVRRGDVLVRLDTKALDAELAGRRAAIRAIEAELAELERLEALLGRQLEADLARAEAELEQARAEADRARQHRAAEIRLAELALEVAEQEQERARQLLSRRAAAPADLASAVAAAREARERLTLARLPSDEWRLPILERALELLGRDYDVGREELGLRREARRAELASARSGLARLERDRRDSVIVAPIDGVVTRGDIRVGDVLEPGGAVAAIAPRSGFRFEAAVPAGEVGRLCVGMPARIKLDAYDFQEYGCVVGTVRFISPDSGAAEGRAGAEYILRVALDGDVVGRGGRRGRIMLGMTGLAEVIVDDESLLRLLLRRIRQTISLG